MSLAYGEQFSLEDFLYKIVDSKDELLLWSDYSYFAIGKSTQTSKELLKNICVLSDRLMDE
jgi:hypothetical protein